MERFKSLVIIGWICLVLVFLMEQFSTVITANTSSCTNDCTSDPISYQGIKNPFGDSERNNFDKKMLILGDIYYF